MFSKSLRITTAVALMAMLMCSMIFMTGCGSSKSPSNPETTTAAQETTTPAGDQEQETTDTPAEDNSTEETTTVSGVVFEIGGMQVGIADPDQERPEGAPEGGDGMTAYSDEELKAAQVAIADSGNRKNMSYADFVEALDGVEGKWTPYSFTNRWKYTWYSSTEATWLEVIFNAETGLYYSDTYYQ